MRKRKGFYSISVVAKMFSVHQQTIRMYEKQGLISPKRSEGNTRLFSEEDVDRLEEVIYLTHKLGVNLAGVEIILKLQKKLKRMQDDMNKMFKDTEGEFELEKQHIRDDIKRQAERLAAIKKESGGQLPPAPPQALLPGGATEAQQSEADHHEEEIEMGDIEIDYDKE